MTARSATLGRREFLEMSQRLSAAGLAALWWPSKAGASNSQTDQDGIALGAQNRNTTVRSGRTSGETRIGGACATTGACSNPRNMPSGANARPSIRILLRRTRLNGRPD
jgi:hypothetical protein